MSDFEQTLGSIMPGSPYFKERKIIDCPDCDGNGYNIWSCCGDDITERVEGYGNDLCPTCQEHCGDVHEECLTCKGEGTIYE